MEAPLPISACITTRNNEETIKKCLESLDGFVNEIIVIDTDSQDNTVEICHRYGAEVIQKSFTGIPDMKRAAIENASNNWVFVIDADESIPPALRQEILNKFSPEEDAAYFMDKKNYMFGEWIRARHPERPLLAKKDAIYFKEDYVMEHLSVKEKYSDEIIHLSNSIHHDIYKDSYEYIVKHNQYSSLDAIRLHDSGVEHTLFYHLFKGIGTTMYYLFISRSILDGWRGLFWSGMHIWYQLLVYQKCIDLRRLKEENPENWREIWLDKCRR